MTSRTHRHEVDVEDERKKKEVNKSIHRLETLTDRLEATTSALEALLTRLKLDEEANRK